MGDSAAPMVARAGAWWRDGHTARLFRLALFAAALLCATIAHRVHLDPNAPWTRWAPWLVAGVGMLIVALWDGTPPASGRLRWLLRLPALAIAIAAGWSGVGLADEPGRELAAGLALITGICGFLVFRWVAFADEDVRSLLGDRQSQHGAVWRPLPALAAIALGIAAAVWNPSHHVLGFGLWLASLVSFAAAFWHRDRLDGDPRWQGESGAQMSPGAERAGLLLIVLVAVALRATVLDAVPAWINPDEGRLGRYAERMWADGFPDAFGLGWNGFPHLSYMVHYAWVQILGTSNPHLRLSAATVGVLGLVPMFYWTRLWWGNVVALMATFLLAVNQTHLMWSRIAFNNIHQVAVAALILLCFARVLRRNDTIDWVWLGFAAGLAFHTYHAAKLLPLLLVPVGVLFALGMSGFVRRCLPGLTIGTVAFILCLGPLIRTTVEGWSFFYLSTSNRVDLNQLIDAHRAGDFASVRYYIEGHVGSSLFAFSKLPTSADAYLSAYTAVPFALGIGWMLWRWRDPRHLTVLVWIAGILVIGGMITDYPPATTRMLGFFPAVCVVPAVVAGRLRALLGRWRFGDAAFATLAIVWLGASAYATWHQFFIVAPPQQRGQPMGEICRVIRAAPLPSTLYMVGGDVEAELTVVQNDCMVEADELRRLVNLPKDASVVPLPPDHTGSGIVLISRLQSEVVPLVRRAYPEARYEIVHDRAGTAVLHVFELSPQVIAMHRGLRAQYHSDAGFRLSEQADAALVPPRDAVIPGLVRWGGQLFVAAPGLHQLRSSAGELRLDGRLVEPETPLRLAAGWHPIEVAVEITAADAPAIVLEWKDNGEWSAVAAQYLNDQASRGGLLGRYFGRAIDSARASPIEEVADYESIDPALSFRYRSRSDDDPPPPFAALPSTMEWIGSVDFDSRPRSLRLEATTPTRVFLGRELVIDLPRDGRVAEIDLPATQGRVPLLVRSIRPLDDDWRYWELRLVWREPGGNWSATADYRLPESVRRAVGDGATP